MELNIAANATPIVTPAVVEPVAPAPEVPAAPPAEPVVEAKEDPKFASRFAALTRREQAARKVEMENKERETRYKAWDDEQKLMTDNPLEYLAKKGLTFDKLTQLALNDGKKPAEMRVQELEEKIEKKEQERIKAEQDAAQKNYETQKTTFVTNIGSFLKANESDYELSLAEDESSELIYNVIETQYQRTKEQTGQGRIMTIKEAADWVEKSFEEVIDTKYSKLTKVKNKFAPPAMPPAPAAPGTAPKQSSTLTNTQASSVPTPSTKQVMTIEESKREAAKILKWV